MQTVGCYWFLSRWEAFGNVVVEAFALGLPIAATTLGIAPDLLARDDRASLLVNPEDPRELAEATGRLLKAGPVLGRDLTPFDGSERSARLIEIYDQAIAHAHLRQELHQS